MAQSFIGSGMRSKSWTKDKEYTSYNISRMTDRSPMLLIGVSYAFKNKVEHKWRQKKQFYNDDNTLQSIGVNK